MAVRATPFGPMSNIQPMTTAIGKPSATSTITRVTDQDGRFSAGSTTEAISITIQPATAYSTSTRITRSEEHTSELQSLMRISYAVFCLKKKKQQKQYEKT